MKNEFNIGDRVRIVADMERPYYMWIEKGDTGVIVEGESSKGFECVRIDGCANMDYVCVESKYLEADATCDPKTAFLSELKGLLEKYGAELGDSGMYEIGGMEVTFDNGDRIRYKHSTINALNIMDYEKE